MFFLVLRAVGTIATPPSEMDTHSWCIISKILHAEHHVPHCDERFPSTVHNVYTVCQCTDNARWKLIRVSEIEKSHQVASNPFLAIPAA